MVSSIIVAPGSLEFLSPNSHLDKEPPPHTGAHGHPSSRIPSPAIRSPSPAAECERAPGEPLPDECAAPDGARAGVDKDAPDDRAVWVHAPGGS